MQLKKAAAVPWRAERHQTTFIVRLPRFRLRLMTLPTYRITASNRRKALNSTPGATKPPCPHERAANRNDAPPPHAASNRNRTCALLGAVVPLAVHVHLQGGAAVRSSTRGGARRASEARSGLRERGRRQVPATRGDLRAGGRSHMACVPPSGSARPPRSAAPITERAARARAPKPRPRVTSSLSRRCRSAGHASERPRGLPRSNPPRNTPHTHPGPTLSPALALARRRRARVRAGGAPGRAASAA